jgi:ligand-binding sensor domain-containing protein
MRFKIFFILIIFSENLFAQSQQLNFQFEHLTEANGLSNNHVQCIFKDSKGYLWFGTEDGLNQFDGNELKILKHQNSSENSLVGNNIKQIAEDKNHHLIICAFGNGISMKSANSNSFKNFTDKNKLASPNDVHFIQDGNKRKWVGDLVYLYEVKNDTNFVLKKKFDGIITNFINFQNQLYISTFKGLYVYNSNADSFKLIPETKNILCANFCQIDENTLAVGTYRNGLFIFDRQHHQSFHFLKDNAIETIQKVKFKNHYQLWIAEGNSLLIADLNKPLHTI